MTTQANSTIFAVKITATGEVRDAQGNLISADPVEATINMTENELRAFLEGDAE